MNRLSTERRAQILTALCEGVSIRAACRMTGAAKGTVLKLLVDVGAACYEYHDWHHRLLPCKRIQCDELWTFVYARKKNIPRKLAMDETLGDAWTWKALDPDTKFLATYLVSPGRDQDSALDFIEDLVDRVDGPVRISTDGLSAYKFAIAACVDNPQHGVCVKEYAEEQRYYPGRPPAGVVAVHKRRSLGVMVPDEISTSHVERSNLTLRMHQRRFTRNTNAFSKKLENLRHAVALHAIHYNYCRPHQTLKGRTPAQALGLADRKWTMEDVAALLD